MGLMFRRRRPIAHLAAGAATAGIAYHAGKRRAEQDQSSQQDEAAYTATQPTPAQTYYVAPPPASTGGEVDELDRLVQMRDAGVLTEAEFTAAKAQLLGL